MTNDVATVALTVVACLKCGERQPAANATQRVMDFRGEYECAKCGAHFWILIEDFIWEDIPSDK